MNKKIINTLIIGTLIFGSTPPSFAARGFTQRLIDAEKANKQYQSDLSQCRTSWAQAVSEKDQEIQNLSNNHATILTEQTNNINSLNHQLTVSQEVVNKQSEEINQLKQEIVDLKVNLNTSTQDLARKNTLLDNKNNELQTSKNTHNKKVIENANHIKNLRQEKENLSNQHEQLLKLLDLAGVNINTLDVQAFIYAAGRGDIETVKALLKAKVNPKAQDSQALIAAAQGGHLEMVKLLLEAGADPKAQYSQALFNAFWNGHFHITNLLHDRGADAALLSRIYKLWSML